MSFQKDMMQSLFSLSAEVSVQVSVGVIGLHLKSAGSFFFLEIVTLVSISLP